MFFSFMCCSAWCRIGQHAKRPEPSRSPTLSSVAGSVCRKFPHGSFECTHQIALVFAQQPLEHVTLAKWQFAAHEVKVLFLYLHSSKLFFALGSFLVFPLLL